jgi:hypothetical protein
MPDLKIPKVETPPVKVKQTFINKIPCNWVITLVADDIITARNNESGERFEGSIAEFNECIRG